jgi:hypothetical protein
MTTTGNRIVQVETRKRSFTGKLVKWSFIFFNILMLIWLIGGMNAAGDGYEAMSEAEKAGTAIGAGIGAMFIVSIWAMGDIILGLLVLLTRGKKIITTEQVG